MPYIDGYVVPVPKKDIAIYRSIARKAGKIWREHGALEYIECVGDDLDVKGMMPFPKGIRAKPGETVVLSWVIFKSKAHRNQVNAAVMADPRLAHMEAKDVPFNCKRMLYGGFKILVKA